MNNKDKYIKGAIIGSAIGDALGMPFEEIPQSLREQMYGTEYITDFVEAKPYKLRQHIPPKGSVTDDTEMILATIHAILESGVIAIDSIAKYLLKWIRRDIDWIAGDIQTRNIGNTTRAAIEKYASGVPVNICGIRNNGYGAAIRISPIAIALDNDKYFIKNIEDIAKFTHKGTIAIESAVTAALAIKHILNMKSKRYLLEDIKRYIRSRRMRTVITTIEDAIKEGAETSQAAEMIGTGAAYQADEVVGMALFLFLKFGNSYRDTVLEAINIKSLKGVDSDSIAAISGCFAGANLGIDHIPTEWINQIEYAELIEKFTSKFIELIKQNGGSLKRREK